jgi:hypothetical protein
MNKKTIFSIFSLALILTLGYARAGLAASTVTVSSPGGGVFVLQGSGIENAAAMDITVAYDTASLSNPRVEQGALVSGALTAVNLNVPGSIRMAIVRVAPIQGSGVIATLTFDRRGGSPGKITALSARLSNIDGRPLPSLVQVVNPSDSSVTASGDGQTRDERQQGASGSGATVPSTSQSLQPPVGIFVVPQTADGGPGIASGATTTTEQTEQTAAAEPTQTARKEDREVSPLAKIAAKNTHKHKSIVERFQEFQRERTPAALMSLFDQDGALGFRQEPPVVIADGKNTVQVTFISDPVKKEASDVAVSGAKLVSLKKDQDYSNTWVAELQPEKDAVHSSLTVFLEKITIVYPLTVAPARDIDLDKSGKVSEADFALFLSKRGTGKKPEFDLNGDGKRDYLDDYLFTANYLALRQGAKAAQTGSK